MGNDQSLQTSEEKILKTYKPEVKKDILNKSGKALEDQMYYNYLLARKEMIATCDGPFAKWTQKGREQCAAAELQYITKRWQVVKATHFVDIWDNEIEKAKKQ